MDLREQRIVVTGGAGFLGRRVCAELLARGVPAERVFVPRSREYDLTGEAAVVRMYQDMDPTVVIHLAGEVGGIGANRAAPGRFFYANLAMGLHLIEHARRRGAESPRSSPGLRKFVQVGTVCSYPARCPAPFREEDLWAGYPEPTNAPYGIAKKALLVMLRAYRAQYGLSGIYLLPVNLYGPGDNFDPETSHVIPAMIRKFCEAADSGAEEVVLWGTGKATREFLYVDDAARGIVTATQSYDDGDPVNLGSGEEISIADLAGRIAALTGFTGRIVWDPSYPDGQPRRRLDTTRAAARLTFRPQTPLDEGLRQTIDWWRNR